MPMVRAYQGGLTVGTGGNHTTERAKRGEVQGWTAASARRHNCWCYSVEPQRLTGYGWAVTLTLRDCPATSDEWTLLLQNFFQGLRDTGLLVRAHWVVEWQTRGAPHLHMAVYLTEDLGERAASRLIEGNWLARTQRWGALELGQDCQRIRDTLDWQKYLAKHAARGVAHYQRQGKPSGWERTGRLWGHIGDWPTVEPIEARVDAGTFYRLRRLSRSWRVADARARARRGKTSWRALTAARGMLRCPERKISRMRGVSDWIPEDVALRLLEVASTR